jgi:hypothetical protein
MPITASADSSAKNAAPLHLYKVGLQPEAEEQSARLPCARPMPNHLLHKKSDCHMGYHCEKKKNLIRSDLPRKGRICFPALGAFEARR